MPLCGVHFHTRSLSSIGLLAVSCMAQCLETILPSHQLHRRIHPDGYISFDRVYDERFSLSSHYRWLQVIFLTIVAGAVGRASQKMGDCFIPY